MAEVIALGGGKRGKRLPKREPQPSTRGFSRLAVEAISLAKTRQMVFVRRRGGSDLKTFGDVLEAALEPSDAELRAALKG